VTDPLRVFIGYDAHEALAYHVLAHSILTRASKPVTIQPVMLSQMRDVYTRERGPKETTDFSISRFMVPYLSGYHGRSIFMDCDMLCLSDIHDVMRFVDNQNEDRAAWVCQHNYEPQLVKKAMGEQTRYPRKNWSSFVVFENERCRALTPEYVNDATGLELHRFLWTPEGTLGSLPLAWNWLVGEYQKNSAARILHYTLGGPWAAGYEDCDHHEEWYNERESLLGQVPGKVARS
jgi:hypothetical protein